MNRIEELSEFITEYRGKGHFLPYEDLELLKKWAELSNSVEMAKVALILAELLEPYVKDSKNLRLKAIDREFTRKIKELKASL